MSREIQYVTYAQFKGEKNLETILSGQEVTQD